MPFILTILSFVFIRIVVIIFHEAGHAVAMRILTKGKVTVYLGSHGDQAKSRNIKMGPYDIWIFRSMLKWKGGLCVPEVRNSSDRSRMIYVAAGPVATLLLSLVVLIVLLLTRASGLPGTILLLFCLWSAYSFCQNLFVQSSGVSANGGIIESDGALVRKLMEKRRLPVDYDAILTLNKEGKYNEAVALCEEAIEKGTKNADIYRMAVAMLMHLRQFQKADDLQKLQVEKIGNLNVKDRVNMALLKVHLGKLDEAIGYYRHLLQREQNNANYNKYNLINFGFALTQKGDYQEAISYLDKGITMDNCLVSPFTLRAYANMRLGNFEEGWRDNEYALQLDSKNPEAYRNKGIYFYEKQDYKKAYEQFEQARELNPEMKNISKYLLDTANKLSERNGSSATT